jgi:uncharacterized membrane protein YcaP (DUF421 family)
MVLLQSGSAFDWKSLLLGEEEWSFLPQILLRSAIMFAVTIIALRIIGRRGIMQGVFELVTIITLGSAAGDPMFYKKVGLLPAILVFTTIVLMYKITNYFVAKYKPFEHVIEGRHVRLIKECRFIAENFKPHELSKDEILTDLRLQGISHLGQVEAAYIEASGEISVFFLPDEKVKYGLPVTPELFETQVKKIDKKGVYSCGFCGYTEKIAPTESHTCAICKKTEWVKSINQIRVR